MSLFHLFIWFGILGWKKFQNFEGITPMVSNVKDILIPVLCMKPVFCLSSLEASLPGFSLFSPEFWNFIMMCFGEALFSFILLAPGKIFQTGNVCSLILGSLLKYFINDFLPVSLFRSSWNSLLFRFLAIIDSFSFLFSFVHVFCSTFWELSLISTLKTFTELFICFIFLISTSHFLFSV